MPNDLTTGEPLPVEHRGRADRACRGHGGTESGRRRSVGDRAGDQAEFRCAGPRPFPHLHDRAQAFEHGAMPAERGRSRRCAAPRWRTRCQDQGRIRSCTWWSQAVAMGPRGGDAGGDVLRCGRGRRRLGRRGDRRRSGCGIRRRGGPCGLFNASNRAGDALDVLFEGGDAADQLFLAPVGIRIWWMSAKATCRRSRPIAVVPA